MASFSSNRFSSDHDNPQQQLHFVLVPLLTQGHLIPMVDLGRLLAARGAARVSIATTPLNAARVRPAVDRYTSGGHFPIHLVELPFPTELTGLPPGCESFDTLPSPEWVHQLLGSLPLLEAPLKRYVQRLQQDEEEAARACIIVFDFSLPWAARVATELGVPRYVLFPTGCFTMYCDRVLPGVYEQEKVRDDVKVVVTGLPHRVEVTRKQARGGYFGALEEFRLVLDEAVTTADGVVVNTFAELELEYVGLFERALGNKVWTVGPISLCSGDVEEKAVRGDTPSADEGSMILSWLDSMPPKSVLYVSFGTLLRPNPDQLAEIGAALEDSRVPFLWVLKTKPEHTSEVDSWLASGFKDRITRESRSLVVRGWAPQLLILSHPSIGGFLTHCGWNSFMEGVAAGVPMITWPGLADQFLNESLIVDVVGVGVRVGVEEPTPWFPLPQQRLVGRQQIAAAVKTVMDGYEGGERDRMRRRTAEVAEMAQKAMEDGGSSRQNLEALVEDARTRLAAPRLAHHEMKSPDRVETSVTQANRPEGRKMYHF